MRRGIGLERRVEIVAKRRREGAFVAGFDFDRRKHRWEFRVGRWRELIERFHFRLELMPGRIRRARCGPGGLVNSFRFFQRRFDFGERRARFVVFLVRGFGGRFGFGDTLVERGVLGKSAELRNQCLLSLFEAQEARAGVGDRGR